LLEQGLCVIASSTVLTTFWKLIPRELAESELSGRRQRVHRRGHAPRRLARTRTR
jgi:hypothetical protein